jgi:peptide/nickel transport system ATP-binding protein
VPMALLEIRNLTTDITLRQSIVHALSDVSLTVESGQTLGVIGESGSGKTMTAMSIERLLPAGGRVTSGSVKFDGHELAGMEDAQLRRIRGRDIGMIFQDPMTSLNPVQSIGSQVAEPLIIHEGLGTHTAKTRVTEMFEMVGIPAHRYDDYPHQLSGGQRQRVMIAMALICRPKLLIADEPTTALDVTIQKQILELIDDLKRDLGMAVVLVTHDLGVIAGYTDTVAVMYAGKVVEFGTTRAMFAHPHHRYTEALFEALPERAAAMGERLYSIPGLPPDLAAPPAGCRFAPRCRFATDECRTVVPALDSLPDEPGSHVFACFVPRTAPLQLELPSAPAASNSAATRETGSPGRSWVTDPVPEPSTAVPLLEIRNVSKDFPVYSKRILRRRVGAASAVSDVSIILQRGQTLGLVGESGCGKTTLGRMVVGLEQPTSGEILIRGGRVARRRGSEARDARRNVQLMFQDSYASLDPRMRIRQILREPLDIHHVGAPNDRDRRVDELLDAVGLPRSASDRYPHEFSGGQRQRIGLARALALHPGLIVADEPVSALDVSIQAQILNLMKELQRDQGITYLFISHDLSVVRYLSDLIAVMYLGKIVEIGPAAEVHALPRHPYTRALIDTIPVANPTEEHAKAKLGVRGELPSAVNPPSGCRFRTRCPIAQEICALKEPPLQSGGGTVPVGSADETVANHRVACHFPLEIGALDR